MARRKKRGKCNPVGQTAAGQTINIEKSDRSKVIRVQTLMNHLSIIELAEPVTEVAAGSSAYKVEWAATKGSSSRWSRKPQPTSSSGQHPDGSTTNWWPVFRGESLAGSDAIADLKFQHGCAPCDTSPAHSPDLTPSTSAPLSPLPPTIRTSSKPFATNSRATFYGGSTAVRENLRRVDPASGEKATQVFGFLGDYGQNPAYEHAPPEAKQRTRESPGNCSPG
jgi:hypothetical protein